MRLLAATVVVGLAASGLLAGLATAGGGSAAEDQYPTTVTMPTTSSAPTTTTAPAPGQQQFKPPGSKPPGAQASAPTGKQSGSGTLPFTGLSLLWVLLVAAGLIVLGVLLRRGVPRKGP